MFRRVKRGISRVDVWFACLSDRKQRRLILAAALALIIVIFLIIACDPVPAAPS